MSAETESSPVKLPSLLNQATLKKKGAYEAVERPEVLLKALAELKSVDKGAEQKQWLWGVGCALSVIGFFVSGVMEIKYGPVGAIAAFIVTLIMCIRSGRLNIPDRRYLLAQQLVEALARDMHPDGKILLRLDINKVNCKANQLAKRTDRTAYRSNWLNMSATLADGSQVSIFVFENMHVKFRKGKVKDKGFELRFQVLFSKKNYGQLELSEYRARQSIRLTAPAFLRALRCKGNSLIVNVKSPPSTFRKESETADELARLLKQLMLASYETLRISLQGKGLSAS